MLLLLETMLDSDILIHKLSYAFLTFTFGIFKNLSNNQENAKLLATQGTILLMTKYVNNLKTVTCTAISINDQEEIILTLIQITGAFRNLSLCKKNYNQFHNAHTVTQLIEVFFCLYIYIYLLQLDDSFSNLYIYVDNASTIFFES